MDQDEIFNMYREVPSMTAKANWVLSLSHGLNDNSSDSEFLRSLIRFYAGFEGIFFYCGFPSILSMGRRNKMVGVAEQFQYILRDESMHLNFGIVLSFTYFPWYEYPAVQHLFSRYDSPALFGCQNIPCICILLVFVCPSYRD